MEIVVPPYRWYPSGTTDKPPAVGNLVALWHQVWRVIEVNDAPEVDWTDEDRQAMEGYKPCIATSSARSTYSSDRSPNRLTLSPLAVVE